MHRPKNSAPSKDLKTSGPVKPRNSPTSRQSTFAASMTRRIRSAKSGLQTGSARTCLTSFRILCSPNEDFRWLNETFDESCRSTFQGCEHSIWEHKLLINFSPNREYESTYKMSYPQIFRRSKIFVWGAINLFFATLHNIMRR